MELTEFLRARLDEDEATAQLACMAHDGSTGRGEWEAVPFVYGPPEEGWGEPKHWEVKDERGHDVVGHQMYEGGGTTERYADHIARHDPARVLAQVAAMRAIMGLHDAGMSRIQPSIRLCPSCAAGHQEHFTEHGCITLRHLAAIWRGHPDYDPAWAPDA